MLRAPLAPHEPCHPGESPGSKEARTCSGVSRQAMLEPTVALPAQGASELGEPLSVASCNMLATLTLEQPVEVVRNHEGGT
jgi:hypothetical protein